MTPNFWQLATTPIFQIQSFPLGMLISRQKSFQFCIPPWKLNNLYCYNICSVVSSYLRINSATKFILFQQFQILSHLETPTRITSFYFFWYILFLEQQPLTLTTSCLDHIQIGHTLLEIEYFKERIIQKMNYGKGLFSK